MGRFRLMTVGGLLFLIGIQLYCVRTYSVTPVAAKFVKQRISEVDEATAAESNAARYFSTGYSNKYLGNGSSSLDGGQEFTPPNWLKWAALFAGTVLVLQGAAIPK